MNKLSIQSMIGCCLFLWIKVHLGYRAFYGGFVSNGFIDIRKSFFKRLFTMLC